MAPIGRARTREREDARRALVADHGLRAERQQGRHLSGPRGTERTDPVDALEGPHQSAGLHPPLDHLGGDAGVDELAAGDEAVLASGDRLRDGEDVGGVRR
jgi:hypothetical protein